MFAVVLVFCIAFFVSCGNPLTIGNENEVTQIGGIPPYYEGVDNKIEENPNHE